MARDTRNILLDAASELMIERDVDDVSIADVAKRSGLRQALITYHFGSKEGMMYAVLMRDGASIQQEIDKLLSSAYSSEEKMRLHLKGQAETLFKLPYYNRLIYSMLRDASAERVSEIGNALVRPPANAQFQILRNGVREGCFRDIDPTMFYVIAGGTMEGLLQSRRMLGWTGGQLQAVAPPAIDVDSLVDEVMRLVLVDGA